MFEDDALTELQRLTDGYPYFVQAYGKATWEVATGSPITRDDVLAAAPDAEAELAVGFFGVRYERATPAERDYMTRWPTSAPTAATRPRPLATWRGTWVASRSRSLLPATA